MAKKKGPDSTSGDYSAMAAYWTLSQTLLDGAAAMRAAGEKYLPKFPAEGRENYKYRRENAKYTNIYRDILENLASKPFAKKLTVNDSAIGTELKALVEDIDGAGNHLHVFAGDVFFNGIAKAIDYIFVDYTQVPTGATVAQEKALGARPYWVRIPAEQIVAVETAMIGGKEEFVHVRILEDVTEREEYTEVTKERVRVYNRAKVVTKTDAGTEIKTYGQPTWQLLEKKKDQQTGDITWEVIESGTLRIDVIPLVPFITGRRKGASWQFHPPMKDAADLQVEHYQQETNLKSAKELTCFPMLVGQGISPKLGADGKPEKVPVGPAAVLYAPYAKDGTAGNWSFIEPGAASLTFLASEVDKTEKQLREIGRQSLTAETGNLTTITAGVAASKGNSAVQAWAFNLKDALERGMQLTAKWLLDTTSKPEVTVYTDFGVEAVDGSSMDRVMTMRTNGDLDQESLWNEAIRRGDLSGDFNKEACKRRLAEEAPDEPDDDDIDAALPPPKGRAPPPTRIAA